MVRTLTSARDIWIFFEKCYQHTDLVYQVSLIKRLVNTNMSEGQAAAKFLDTWQALLDEVLLSGLAIPETLQSMFLLAALPSTWRAFIITHASTSELQLQSLVAKIHQEEALREQSSGSQTSVALATTLKPARHASHGKNGHHHSHNNNKNYNTYNNQKNHWSSGSYEQVQCTFCHRYGHVEEECRTKQRQQGKKSHHNHTYQPNTYNGHHYNNNNYPHLIPKLKLILLRLVIMMAILIMSLYNFLPLVCIQSLIMIIMFGYLTLVLLTI